MIFSNAFLISPMKVSENMASEEGNVTCPSETGLGEIDLQIIGQGIQNSTKKRQAYVKYSPEDRYSIGKYASVYGPAACTRKFRKQFPNLNESTARTFRKTYESELANSKREGRSSSTSLVLKPRGRPLLLGDMLDNMVQRYIQAASNRGAVISRGVAVSTAKALMSRHTNVVGNIDIESSHWAQSLFRRMGYRRRRATTSKLEIPEGALKEAKLLFHHDIVSKVEKFKIPHSLIINLDQTPTKYVPVGRSSLAKKTSSTVTVKGSSDKRTITATFAISFRGDFMPMQLIYGGKTTKCLPRFKFPEKFSLSYNETHYSNENEACKFIEDILQPYINNVIKRENLPANQKSLVIMDVFKGQMTPVVLNLYKDCNIEVVCVPPNMTHILQPLDLTVNGSVKKFTRGKFNAWYSSQIGNQLDAGKQLHDIDVPLRLSLLKPLHAQWLVDCYNHMTTEAAQNIIHGGWKAAGISEALRMGSNGLESLDPFQDLDPMIEQEQESNRSTNSILNASEDQISGFKSRFPPVTADDTDSDSDWEDENTDLMRNAFDAFNDEPDF